MVNGDGDGVQRTSGALVDRVAFILRALTLFNLRGVGIEPWTQTFTVKPTTWVWNCGHKAELNNLNLRRRESTTRPHMLTTSHL
jgi:hypothetical protein